MPIYRQVPSLPQGRELVKRPTPAMSISVVASPRFDRESEPNGICEERLALHKNHEGRAQAVREMRVYGTTAHGASDIRRTAEVW